ncbi:PGAP1-like alpha/beta domain-containing protein [Bacillus sp. UNC41MFS5]|uniref:PGAP1-like alpha/beta domain-containing protein n=1 Tax=Bacillus sp. UNC41MFS5 TaxID=1449046 RepID=UPI00047EDAF1|nr:hypothetical protein [Bacillus sp. UNC41MFS5]
MKEIEFIHQENNKNVVLFIHGFQGNSDTWRHHNGVYFPKLLLKEGVIAKNYDIAVIYYYTKLRDFYKFRTFKNLTNRYLLRKDSLTLKIFGIEELGDSLKTIIDLKCNSYKNIIIIAHSMGGLVAKSYILDSLNQSEPKVQLFISLAVPHEGTELATLGKLMFRKHAQLEDLKPISKSINRLRKNWIKIDKGLPRTVYLYGRDDAVVDPESAVGTEKGEPYKRGFRTDHYLIAKPESTDNLVYEEVVRQLVQFTGEDKRKPILAIVEKVKELGNEIYGTVEGNKVSEELYELCRNNGEYFLVDDIVSLVEGVYSRIGINALGNLYNKYPEYIKSMNLPHVFKHEIYLSYYCKLREKYKHKDILSLLMNADEINWVIDGVTIPTDEIDLFDKSITRGHSVIVEYAYSVKE